MAKTTEHLFVLTGGPGSGKSTLIDALAQPATPGPSKPAAPSSRPGRDRRPALPWREILQPSPS